MSAQRAVAQIRDGFRQFLQEVRLLPCLICCFTGREASVVSVALLNGLLRRKDTSEDVSATSTVSGMNETNLETAVSNSIHGSKRSRFHAIQRTEILGVRSQIDDLYRY